MIILHLNRSTESDTLKAAIIRSGLPFRAYFYTETKRTDLPGIETIYGTIWGWSNILRFYKIGL